MLVGSMIQLEGQGLCLDAISLCQVCRTLLATDPGSCALLHVAVLQVLNLVRTDQQKPLSKQATWTDKITPTTKQGGLCTSIET